MLKRKTMEYIHIDDVCELFGLNVREFSFTEDCENGSFYFLHCSDTWIEDTLECMRDVEGSHYEAKYCNTLALQRYLRNEMNISDGIHIYVSW